MYKTVKKKNFFPKIYQKISKILKLVFSYFGPFSRIIRNFKKKFFSDSQLFLKDKTYIFRYIKKIFLKAIFISFSQNIIQFYNYKLLFRIINNIFREIYFSHLIFFIIIYLLL